MNKKELQESVYLNKNQKTSLNKDVLKKISKRMDRKRDVKLEELYEVAFSKSDNIKLFNILNEKDFKKIRDEFLKFKKVDLEDLQIANVLSPYVNSKIIIEMKYNITEKHLNFIEKAIVVRVLGNKGLTTHYEIHELVKYI